MISVYFLSFTFLTHYTQVTFKDCKFFLFPLSCTQYDICSIPFVSRNVYICITGSFFLTTVMVEVIV